MEHKFQDTLNNSTIERGVGKDVFHSLRRLNSLIPTGKPVGLSNNPE